MVEDLVLVGPVPVAPEQAAAAAAPVLDVVADDLEAAGLVEVVVVPVRVERVGVGGVAVIVGCRGHAGAGDGLVVDRTVLARREAVPHTRGAGRERRGGVLGVGEVLRRRVGRTRAVLAAVPRGQRPRGGGAGAPPEGVGHGAGLVGVAVPQAGPADAAGRALGRLEGVPREFGPARGRGGGGPDGGGEAGGLVPRGLVARGLVARREGVDRPRLERADLVAVRLRFAGGAVLGRGMSPPPVRTAGPGHDRARLPSRNCCRITTAAAWSITERCLRLSMPPSRR